MSSLSRTCDTTELGCPQPGRAVMWRHSGAATGMRTGAWHGGAAKIVKLRDLVYRLYARRVEGRLDHDPGAQAHRRHPGREPALGEGVRRHDGAGPPGGGRQDLRAAGLVRRDRRRGRHPLAAVHGQPGPARGRAPPAAQHHREHRARPRRRRPLAGPPRRQPRHPARPDPDRAEGGRAGHRATSTGYSSTSPSATAAARRSPTPSARCCWSTPRRAPPSRSSPRSSTSTTSPSTSTPAASPTRTW